MNIHEHQAKALLKKFGAPVPNGISGKSVEAGKAISATKLLVKG